MKYCLALSPALLLLLSIDIASCLQVSSALVTTRQNSQAALQPKAQSRRRFETTRLHQQEQHDERQQQQHSEEQIVTTIEKRNDNDDTATEEDWTTSSTINSPENQSPQNYKRDEKWLETATNKFLEATNGLANDDDESDDGLMPPMLSMDDVNEVKGLMSAWARRGSPLMVEQLLKRIIDDMRAGNDAIFVSTRFYAIAMDAWVKSGLDGSADRAQAIHDNMKRMHHESGDVEIAPTVVSYNTLISAWAKTQNGQDRAELVLREMVVAWQQGGHVELKPDSTTFAHLVNGYSRQEKPNIQRAEQLLLVMDEMGVKKTFYIYGALQNAYARSHRKDGPEKTKALLEEMVENYTENDPWLKPTVVNFNTVLNACSQHPSVKAARMAVQILEKMRKPVEEGGYDIEPDRVSYLMTIYACASCPDQSIGAPLAEKVLTMMEQQARDDIQEREDSQGMAPPRVTLGTEGYNAVLSSWARNAGPDSVDKAIAIVHRMEKLAEEGFEAVRPNRRSYNAILNTMVRSTSSDVHRAKKMAERATRILRAMWKGNADGNPFCKPDSYSYTALLILHQKTLTYQAADKADELIREMEQLHEDGILEYPADVVHYTIVISILARSRAPDAVHRCSQILLHMMERHKAGFPNCAPNNRTYNAFIDALSRARQDAQAERVLYYMLDQYRLGAVHMAPDSFSFNSVMIACCKSRRKGCGQQAENILERLLQYCEEENTQVLPNERSFVILINYYGLSKFPDAPYRAEFILNRMVDLCRKRGTCIPGLTSKCFLSVIEGYATRRLKDGGNRAERLLRVMKELRQLDGASNLKIDSSVLASVMLAWAHSGDDLAGQKVEYHLDAMERRYADGLESMRPNTRCYGIALSAWTRSSVEGKARRALSVLRRMEDQIKLGNKAVSPSSFAKSLVINACSFSNRSFEEETDAFEIAVTVFNEMESSENYEQPLSVSYGWFIQLCGRLSVAEDEKVDRIRAAFHKCCEQGLVNDFVLIRLKGAAPPPLYVELLQPVSERLDGKELPPVVRMNHLPPAWKRNSTRNKRDDDRIWWTSSDK